MLHGGSEAEKAIRAQLMAEMKVRCLLVLTRAFNSGTVRVGLLFCQHFLWAYFSHRTDLTGALISIVTARCACAHP